MADERLYESDTLDASKLRRNYTPLPTEKPIVEEKSGLLETSGAFLRTENPVGRAVVKERGRNPDRVRDTSFDFTSKIKDDDIRDEDEIGYLASAVNEADYEALRDDYARINSDRATIENAGIITGLGAGLLTAPLDPLNYIPFAGVGGGVVRSAVRVGASALPIATAREAILQAQQPQRTLTEGVVNVAGETALAGIIGGGIGLIGGKLANSKVAEAKKQELGNTLPEDIANGRTDDVKSDISIDDDVLDQPRRQGADLSRETYYIDENPIRPDDINGRLEAVRATGKPLQDAKGTELPEYVDPTIRTRNLRAEGKSVLSQRGKVKVDDVFLSISRNNGNDRLDALIDKYGIKAEHPKWNYTQLAKEAVHRYIFDGDPSGDEITRRLTRFEEWEASYKSGQYFKAIDKAESVDNASELARAYDEQADAIYTRIDDDIDARVAIDEAGGQVEVAVDANIASDIKGFIDDNYIGDGKLKSAEVKYDEANKSLVVKWEC